MNNTLILTPNIPPPPQRRLLLSSKSIMDLVVSFRPIVEVYVRPIVENLECFTCFPPHVRLAKVNITVLTNKELCSLLLFILMANNLSNPVEYHSTLTVGMTNVYVSPCCSNETNKYILVLFDRVDEFLACFKLYFITIKLKRVGVSIDEHYVDGYREIYSLLRPTTGMEIQSSTLELTLSPTLMNSQSGLVSDDRTPDLVEPDTEITELQSVRDTNYNAAESSNWVTTSQINYASLMTKGPMFRVTYPEKEISKPSSSGADDKSKGLSTSSGVFRAS